MKPVHKARLRKLIRFLKALPEKHFDLAYFKDCPISDLMAIGRGEDPHNPCGSAACVIGWCPVVFPKLWRYHEYDDMPSLVGSSTFWRYRQFAKFIGIEPLTAEKICRPGTARVFGGESLAATIEKLEGLLCGTFS